MKNSQIAIIIAIAVLIGYTLVRLGTALLTAALAMQPL